MIRLTTYCSASSVAPFLPMMRPDSAPCASRKIRSPSSKALTSASIPIRSRISRSAFAAASRFSERTAVAVVVDSDIRGVLPYPSRCSEREAGDWRGQGRRDLRSGNLPLRRRDDHCLPRRVKRHGLPAGGALGHLGRALRRRRLHPRAAELALLDGLRAGLAASLPQRS